MSVLFSVTVLDKWYRTCPSHPLHFELDALTIHISSPFASADFTYTPVKVQGEQALLVPANPLAFSYTVFFQESADGIRAEHCYQQLLNDLHHIDWSTVKIGDVFSYQSNKPNTITRQKDPYL